MAPRSRFATLRTLKVCRVPWFCTQPVINDRIVAWVETRRRRTGRLVVRSLRTGRTRATTVRDAGDRMKPLLAGDRLFLLSGGHVRRVAQ